MPPKIIKYELSLGEHSVFAVEVNIPNVSGELSRPAMASATGLRINQ